MADNGVRVIAVAVDVGGTFTDVVALRTATGEGQTLKVPSTPGRLADAVIAGTLAVLGRLNAEPADVSRFVHGTTVGTNAVLERRGATVGLLTTEGFEDVLEIGRTKRRVLYDLNIEVQTPVFLAPRRRRLGVRERLGSRGEIVAELDETQAGSAIDELLAQEVDAVAICLLHAYTNDVHERRLRELVLSRAPDMRVSLSSEVDPVFREYERTVVTCFDAYLRPVVAGYLEKLTSRLSGEGIACPLQVMQSRGGIASARHGGARPVSLLLSGPAAGVVGATAAALGSGLADVVTLDVGGTSADVALVENGRPVVTSDGGIEDFPLRVPLVDVSTIGAGGGSIAWLDNAGGLRVGPSSAGASPGPICYGRGGVEPTLTDAFAVLGYLDPH
ncbi:MAG: hydantoinase/oxoprolinase family protein, partial [Gaiellaceae bacterium]